MHGCRLPPPRPHEIYLSFKAMKNIQIEELVLAMNNFYD